ncbi:MAG: type IV pilin N-terminal domain-containing protein [Candidatus Bathyarchaeota archaeon]|nr:type IV pilin N-terminal domain-containing protein [Candidatus Bathyarchaeota archaeon]
MKRLLKSKSGVSPVIATVLMILVTMVGMTLLFGFVTYYADTYQSGIGSQVRELLVVEDIWINPPGSDLNHVPVKISIYNAGKIDSIITSVYVNGLSLTEKSPDDDSYNNFNLNIKVPQGGHISVTLYRNVGVWSPGEYTFTVGTKTGSTFDTNYRIP